MLFLLWIDSVDDKEQYRVSPRMELLLPDLGKLTPMVEDWALGLKDLSELEVLMSKDQWADGTVAQKYAYTHEGVDEFEAENYSTAMFQSVEPMASALVEKVDFSQFNSVSDVGGGFGKLAETIQHKSPSIPWVGIFDLPSAQAGFRKLQESGEVSSALTYIPGVFFDKPIEALSDCVVLNRILFDCNDARAAQIVKFCFRPLKPGGALVVQEGCYRPKKNRIAAAGLHFLVGGQLRTPKEVVNIIQRSSEGGFSQVDIQPSKIPEWYIFTARKKG